MCKTQISPENRKHKISPENRKSPLIFDFPQTHSPLPDSKFSFNYHVDDICKKASLKLNSLSRITPHLDFKKKKLSSFFMSQFNYYQLILLCYNRTKNNKINRPHERCLSLLYNSKKSSFLDLLEMDSSVSIHHGNLRVLATEMYRICNDMAPEILTEIFP